MCMSTTRSTIQLTIQMTDSQLDLGSFGQSTARMHPYSTPHTQAATHSIESVARIYLHISPIFLDSLITFTTLRDAIGCHGNSLAPECTHARIVCQSFCVSCASRVLTRSGGCECSAKSSGRLPSKRQSDSEREDLPAHTCATLIRE